MVVGLGSAFSTDSIHAEPTTESIQNERADINEDISKAETEGKDIMVKIEKWNIEIEELNKEIKCIENKSSDGCRKKNIIERVHKLNQQQKKKKKANKRKRKKKKENQSRYLRKDRSDSG